MTRDDALEYRELLKRDIWIAEQRLARYRLLSPESQREQLHIRNRKSFLNALERHLIGERVVVNA